MTREEIIEMVEEAGPIVRTPFDVWCKRFAALVAAAEREACLEAVRNEWMTGSKPTFLRNLEDAILARGDI